MGRELFESSTAAAEVFRRCDSLRAGTSDQCFGGTDDELKDTANTQPCMLAVELACAAALEERGVRADMAAGFSLGEVAALTYAGIFSQEDGFRLVCRRGEFMKKAAEEHPASMAAVLKLSPEQVENICAGIPGAYPVNYNCPGQVSVALAEGALAPLTAAAREAGGRVMPLKVSGGFHSPFMVAASEQFAAELAQVKIGGASVPVYANLTGGLYPETPDEIRRTLAAQISSPVRWETIVRAMAENGVDTFVELGPGHTLCGLISKTLAGVRTFPVEDMAGLAAAAEAIC